MKTSNWISRFLSVFAVSAKTEKYIEFLPFSGQMIRLDRPDAVKLRNYLTEWLTQSSQTPAQLKQEVTELAQFAQTASTKAYVIARSRRPTPLGTGVPRFHEAHGIPVGTATSNTILGLTNERTAVPGYQERSNSALALTAAQEAKTVEKRSSGTVRY
jgi:hypothetical protein